MIKPKNIFRDSEIKLPGELVEILLGAGNIVRLERVVSPDSDTPSQVYDQEEEEFAMVLRGYAVLEFQNEKGAPTETAMKDGDYITIPPHLKHRVMRTKERTTWLCLFYKNQNKQ